MIINNKLIEDYMTKNNLNRGDFCKLCGISAFTLQKMLGDVNITNMGAIYRVRKVLQVDMIDLMKK